MSLETVPIRPRKKRLLVEPIEDKLTSSLIEVVEFDTFNIKSSGVESKSWTKGRVIALSDDCDHVNGAKIGDIVVFTRNGGLPFRKHGKDYLLLSEKDLMYIEENVSPMLEKH